MNMKKVIALCALLMSTVYFGSAQSVQEARKLTDNEQYEAASDFYQKLISTNPSDVVLYYFFGDNLLLSGDPDSAKLLFDKAALLDPNALLAKVGRAKLLMNSTNIHEAKVAHDKDPNNPELKNRLEEATANVAEALKIIDEIVAKAPSKDPRVLIESAEALIHYNNKDLEKAKAILDKAAAIDKANEEINLLYGDIYTEYNNGSLAAEYYNKALDINKNSARALVSKGRLYRRSTNNEGAALEFQNAITIDPNYAPAHRELGEVSYKLGKLEKAKEEYRKYLDLSKNNCGARLRYASFLYVSKSYAESISELLQVEQRCDSNNLLLLRLFTYDYTELKECEKALAKAKKLFDLLPPDHREVRDYEFYGKTLACMNMDSMAIEMFQKALALDPNRCDLLSEVANCWFKLKQYPNAILALQQKFSCGKDIKATDYFNIGRSYFYNNQFNQADSAFKTLNDMQPKYATGWLWRANTNSNIDSTSENGLAKPFYEKYDSLAQADSANASKYTNGLIKAYGYLAYYYILKNDKEKALFYLKKKLALPLEPDDQKNVKKAIDQLEGRTPGTK